MSEVVNAADLRVDDQIKIGRHRVRLVSCAKNRGVVAVDYMVVHKDGSDSKREGWTTFQPENLVTRFQTTLGEARADQKEGHNMATVTRKKGAKKGAKKSGAKASTNGKPASSGRAKFAPTKAEVTAIAKRLREGAKMKEIKAEVGLSNSQPIRNALLEAGFDSKGAKNPDGLSAREVRAKNAATKKAAAKKSGGKKGR